jgi:hypothetical protein
LNLKLTFRQTELETNSASGNGQPQQKNWVLLLQLAAGEKKLRLQRYSKKRAKGDLSQEKCPTQNRPS